jgi:hypothetical protein
MNKKKPSVCEFCDGKGTRDILHRGTNERHRVKCACKHELPIRFVYQGDRSGCCIAAAAMVVGQKYFDVKQLLNIETDLRDDGVTIEQVRNVFEYYGFAYQTRYHQLTRLCRDRDVWPCEPWADVHFCEVINTRASGQHAIVLLRDGRVLDPWWGVLQGLHRYPRVVSMTAVYKVGSK